MALNSEEKELVGKVIEVAGCDEKEIPRGVRKVLQGINDKARRTYLWNALSKAAKEEIRRAQKKYSFAH